jgi:hypothetical protein
VTWHFDIISFLLGAAIEPVSVEPFKPNETPFEFEKVIALRFWLVVPAEKFTLPWDEATVADAVIVEPFRPKETLFEFERTKFVRFCDVVPAETLIVPAMGGTTDAVIVLPASPNETPFEFEKTTVPLEARVVPAESARMPPEKDVALVAVTIGFGGQYSRPGPVPWFDAVMPPGTTPRPSAASSCAGTTPT